MSLEEITLALFAACNSIRVVAYVPQIFKAANDKNGASSISCTTWTLFLIAHLSTVAYALINRSDWGLAACFATNAICCVAILAVAYWKRRKHAKRLCRTNPSALYLAAREAGDAGPADARCRFWHVAPAERRTLSDHCDHCGNERNWRWSRSVDYADPTPLGDAAARRESKKRDLMATNKSTAPTWSEVKATLALFDRAGLVGLLSDLHSQRTRHFFMPD